MTIKQLTSMLAVLAVGSATLVATAGSTVPAVTFGTANSGHSVRVEGTSNVHDWEGTTKQISGWISVPGKWTVEGDGLRLEPAMQWDDAHASFRVSIPAGSLEGNRRGLARNMHRALESSDHPNITFQFDGAANEPASYGDGSYTWNITGDLTVAGKTSAVDLQLVVNRLDNDQLRIRVEKPLKMTDFDIDPPTAMLGAARAADNIDVEITWIVERRIPQPTTPQTEVPTEHRKTVTALVGAYMMMYEGIRDLNRETVAEGVSEGMRHIKALESLDNDALPDADEWNRRVQTLTNAVQAVGDAASGLAVREALADTSDALFQILETAGHDHASTLMAYRYPDQRNVAGRTWLQPYGANIDVKSPYGRDLDDGPKVIAIFPGAGAGQ